MNYAILRVAKLRTIGSVASSGRHTFREVKTPNTDPERLKFNGVYGAKDAAELIQQVRDRLPAKRRKDAVLAIEYLIAASPEWFGEKWRETQNYRMDYFKQALAWLQTRHGAENVVAAQVHLDEKTPHMCVYVVPRTRDGRLSAKEFLGGRSKLGQMQTDFANSVGKLFGLERGVQGSRAHHTTVKQFYARLNSKPKLTLPDAPADLSLIDIASGRSARELKDYRAKLVQSADTIRRAAEIAQLGSASRQGQAKALKKLRDELAEAERLKGQLDILRRELDSKMHELESKEKENDRLKSDLSNAEQTISNQSSQLATYRRQSANEKDDPLLSM